MSTQAMYDKHHYEKEKQTCISFYPVKDIGDMAESVTYIRQKLSPRANQKL